ncbi:hypothetical protein [Shewanella frigidimarina]|jgi:hypothetical protein|uniref:hypothetical protein n=1 Tax=Shewanella frigidimarina TaxID=56812 RepID=UPI000F4F59EC|nr:hypothetical protein [Shewanella frigidimarina]RPA35189.1 hypothetical protein EGC78_04925 [Shewanella frigidimarina]
MKTLEVNQKKIIETKALLLSIITSPLDFIGIEILLIALKSQSGLAKFSDIERNIYPCSLNTLKSASESLLDRGFLELDELRIKARDGIDAAAIGDKAIKSTRAGLKNKVGELEVKLDTMHKCHFLLSIMISELRRDLKQMAYSSDSFEQRRITYQEMNKKIKAKLSFTQNGEV